jgi:transposase-like protein
VSRRENVAPTLFYRWKTKFKEAGIAGLQTMKRGPKAKDHEKRKLEREVNRLTAALCESSIELLLLKKA